ncbi:hypothetical protein BHM03_00027688 [Ensete ventricosum]|uniref:Helicase C-terminal domain-containing protein n=1 Tax=Ensete ventricosum TaxID=4639 RepID=A0A445MHI2_ENSVE|nr:hypothetical protein BHM03_00027688 [Ensete ventricosum]
MVDFSRNRLPTVDFWRYRPVAGSPCTGNLEDRYVPHGQLVASFLLLYAVAAIVVVVAFSKVENLRKFKSEDGDCPTLVCTDLAARGLDLDVDHVIMFDFPLNSVSLPAHA